MSYLDIARKALEKISPAGEEANQRAHGLRNKRIKRIKGVWTPTPEEEAAFCRVIEKDQGLPPGSLKLYATPDMQTKGNKP